MLDQRGKKLDPHEDVPADIVLVLDDDVVFVADDVAVSLEPGHEIEFIDHVLDYGLVVVGQVRAGHPVSHGALDLVLTRRDGQGFQGRTIGDAKLSPLHSVDLCDGAFPDLFRDIP